jgi:hypothetical protein
MALVLVSIGVINFLSFILEQFSEELARFALCLLQRLTALWRGPVETAGMPSVPLLEGVQVTLSFEAMKERVQSPSA